MADSHRIKLLGLLAIAGVVMLWGCGGDTENGNDNLAPRIVTFEVDAEIIEPEAQAHIMFKAVDLDGDPLSYEWLATGGVIEGDDSGAVWTAPEEERKYRLQVTVSDGQKTATSSVDVQVWRTRPGDYYPLAVGNIWTYRDSEDASNRIVFEIVDTIEINLRSGELVKSYVLAKYNPDEPEETRIYNFSYLGKRMDENGKVVGIDQHAQNITSGTEDTILFSPFLPLYNFPLIPGNRWSQTFEAELTPELFPIGGGRDDFEVLSEETVTVPAGTFEHVFQVQETFLWSFFDRDLDRTVVQKWIGPNVGIIKFTQMQTRADVTVEVVFELESFELSDAERT